MEYDIKLNWDSISFGIQQGIWAAISGFQNVTRKTQYNEMHVMLVKKLEDFLCIE